MMIDAAEAIRRQFPAVARALAPACKGGTPRAVTDRNGDHVECNACKFRLPAGYDRVPETTFSAWCRR